MAAAGDPPHAFPPVYGRARRTERPALRRRRPRRTRRLLAAYRRGIFPWYSTGQPILWWSPDPRAVLVPGELRVSRSLRDNPCGIAAIEYRSTGIRAVVTPVRRPARCGRRAPGSHRTCARPTRGCTALGHAHSVETWRRTDLVGGLYGVALGRVFFGESMFSSGRDASKVALDATGRRRRCARLRADRLPDRRALTSRVLERVQYRGADFVAMPQLPHGPAIEPGSLVT